MTGERTLEEPDASIESRRSSRAGTHGVVILAIIALGAAVAIPTLANGEDAGANRLTAHAKGKGKAKPADTVLRNGYVYTVDPADEVAHAVAIHDGRIVFVGSNATAGKYVGRRTEVVDLEGRMVMPGIHDAHIHGVSVGNPVCSFGYAPMTQADFVARVEECLADPQFGSGPDAWLSARDWYLQFTQPPGTPPFTKEVLDAIDTERPIIIRNWDGHTSLANSRALELAGITPETQNPPDGVIEHDENGEPNGLLQDGAQGLVSRVIPPGPPVDPVEAARKGVDRLNSQGITSFYVPGSSETQVETFQNLRGTGELDARAHFALRVAADDVANVGEVLGGVGEARKLLERPRQLSRQVYAWRPNHKAKGPKAVAAPGVSIDGVKVFLDGVIQAPAQTAAMLNPYLTNVGTPEDPEWVPRTDEGARGQLYVDNPELGRLIRKGELAGVQAHLHTDGDRATRVGLDAVEVARRANGFIDSRPGLAHNEITHPSDWPRFGRLGALPVMSHQWSKPGPDNVDSVKDYVGPVRWDRVEAVGNMYGAGAKIVFGSDFPVDPLNEWLAIEVAVLREADWEEDFPEFDFPQYAGELNDDPGLSLSQAIRSATLNAAYSMHQDRVTGSLEKGKLADLVVLDQNLFEIPADDISETNAVMTMVGGEVVYESAP